MLWQILLGSLYLVSHITTSLGQVKVPGYRLIEKPDDLKEFKKLLRTKTNVLVLFTAKGENSAEAKPWILILSEAADKAYGKGTVAIVNCGSDDGKKLCKQVKVSPDTILLKHYLNGDYHKDYDRNPTSSSVVKFLLDPKGDQPWEEDSSAKDVIHLTNENSLQKLLKKSVPILVMFYAPWCGFCKRFKPDFALAATDLKGSALLAGMDIDRDENSGVARKFNITGFPTIIYFEEGKQKFIYGGELNRAGVVEWMKDPQPPKEKEPEKKWSDEVSDIVHLTDVSFHTFVSENPSVLVMFYAPWCGHCKAMKPDYVTVAEQLKEAGVKGILAAVDATEEKGVAKEFEIQGYPSVKYFQDGKFAWDLVERKAEQILSFMKDPKEPPAPPAPEPNWAETPGDVIHLTDETFKTELKKKKHALVMFYAPWCGHCKAAKPEFSAAATTFKDEPKILLGAVDCTVNDDVCKEYDVRGFPTLIYFSYLKNSEPYTGGRTQPDFESFIAKAAGIAKEADTKEQPEKPKKPAAEDLDFDPAVVQLAPENFEESLKGVKSSLVMFFAPWCGHCKRVKPELSEAAKSLKDQSEYAFGAMDCTVYKDFCSDQKVTGYPTLNVYKNGKFANKYTGGRTKADFIAGVQGKTPEKPPAPEFLFEPSVKILTIDNFDDAVNGAKNALVMFYAPWCGHCKRAKPDFSAAATELAADKTKLLGAVDCTVHKELCSKHSIRGFPTLLLFEDGKFREKHAGGRSKGDFVAAVGGAKAEENQDQKEEKKKEEKKEKPPTAEFAFDPAVKVLNLDTFEEAVKGVKNSLIMFYAPWCGHCKRAKPDFSAAATELKDDPTKLLGAVDCTQHRDLCQKYEVRGFPTLLLFESGKMVQKHSGGRTKDDFIAAVSAELKAEQKPEEASKAPPPAQPTEDFGSAVKQLTGETFESSLKSAEAALVMFYAPWCGHCKRAKPEFSEAAKKVEGDKRMLVGAVDCTKFKELCSKHNVRGYPSFGLFANGVHVREYNGGRSAGNFIEGISSINKVDIHTEL